MNGSPGSVLNQGDLPVSVSVQALMTCHLAFSQGSKMNSSTRRSFMGSITVLKADRLWFSLHPLGHNNDPSLFLNKIFLH